MIAEVKQDRPHYHKVEKRTYDHARDDQLKLVIAEEFAVLGRRVAIHLSQHQFSKGSGPV
jgi:hypothetical protein